MCVSNGEQPANTVTAETAEVGVYGRVAGGQREEVGVKESR